MSHTVIAHVAFCVLGNQQGNHSWPEEKPRDQHAHDRQVLQYELLGST